MYLMASFIFITSGPASSCWHLLSSLAKPPGSQVKLWYHIESLLCHFKVYWMDDLSQGVESNNNGPAWSFSGHLSQGSREKQNP